MKTVNLSDQFNKADDAGKKAILNKLHREDFLSLREIAATIGTYPAKVKKMLIAYGIEIMSKNESISHSLKRSENHPTRGKERDISVKQKIGDKMAKTWESPTHGQLEGMKKHKKYWKKMSKAERSQHTEKASKALRETTKSGSKLERYIKERLFEAGYSSVDHKTAVLPNEKLEFDLYIAELSTIIEVDGPVHNEPIFGQEKFVNTVSRDERKTSTAIAAGFTMVRVKQNKNYSETYFRHLGDSLLEVVKEIRSGSKQKLYIVE